MPAGRDPSRGSQPDFHAGFVGRLVDRQRDDLRRHLDGLLRFGNRQFQCGDANGRTFERELATIGRRPHAADQLDRERMQARFAEQQRIRSVAGSLQQNVAFVQLVPFHSQRADRRITEADRHLDPRLAEDVDRQLGLNAGHVLINRDGVRRARDDSIDLATVGNMRLSGAPELEVLGIREDDCRVEILEDIIQPLVRDVDGRLTSRIGLDSSTVRGFCRRGVGFGFLCPAHTRGPEHGSQTADGSNNAGNSHGANLVWLQSMDWCRAAIRKGTSRVRTTSTSRKQWVGQPNRDSYTGYGG